MAERLSALVEGMRRFEQSVERAATGVQSLGDRVLARTPVTSGGHQPEPTVPAPSPFTLDAGRLTVDHGTRSARLTPTEWQLLVELVRAQGAPLSRRELAARAWGTPFRAQEVEVYVCRLRRKLAQVGEPEAIQTVRGVGYRAVVEAAAPAALETA